jgi:hypothetical protein
MMKAMKKYTPVSLMRVAFAALVIVAITTQLIDSIRAGKNIVNFFSFFTIESNILAAVLLLILGIAGLAGVKKSLFEYMRGAAVLYMTMTGVIYIILLSADQSTLLLPWVNKVLHYVMPVAVLIDWLVNPPLQRISYKKALTWLTFPLIYLVYSFIRGPLVGWYPYPFIDPTTNSIAYILTTCIIILICVLVLVRILIIRPRKQ